ncbi:MAG: rhodanese-like domain-containing protein [Chitinophagales bacterium]|jgi:rhodanese-related sulfurtransferase
MRILTFIALIAFIAACKNDPGSNAATPTSAPIDTTSTTAIDTTGPLVEMDGTAFESLIMKNKNIPLFDLRSAQDFKAGHIYRATSLPFDTTGGAFAQRFNTLDRSLPIALYCNSGYFSRKAAQLLFDMQYTKVYILKNGVISWLEAEKVLVTF